MDSTFPVLWHTCRDTDKEPGSIPGKEAQLNWLEHWIDPEYTGSSPVGKAIRNCLRIQDKPYLECTKTL